jgi:hypothetical protein
MLTAHEFRERWQSDSDSESLMTFPPNALADVVVSDEAKTFLKTVGLPESAAPFLDFCVPDSGTLPTVSA